MTRFVIVYASREGQTQKVAHHVAKQVENLGHIARLINVGDDEPDALAGEFDAAVMAGDLDSADRASALAEFVKKRKAELEAVPTALLCVSLEAAVKGARGLKSVQQDIDAFEEATGLHPDRTLPVAGAFHDRSHGGLTRTLYHVWMFLRGIRPDPSGHTELTDWAALENFIGDFVAQASGGMIKKTPAEAKPARGSRKSRAARPGASGSNPA